MERYDQLTYEDLRQYYRSVTPEQNRWWFLDIDQWRIPPFAPRGSVEYPEFNAPAVFSWGHLWFAVALLESLSEARRNEIFTKGDGLIRLEDIPPVAQRQLTEWARKSLVSSILDLDAFHPAYQVREKWLESYKEGARRGFLLVLLEQKRTSADKQMLILRTTADTLFGAECVFTFNHRDVPYEIREE